MAGTVITVSLSFMPSQTAGMAVANHAAAAIQAATVRQRRTVD
jgi:hypothetical protein